MNEAIAKPRIEELEALTAILETTNDLVSTALPNGQITYLNQAGRKLLGCADDVDVRSKKITDAHPDWARRIVEDQGIPAAIQSGSWEGETAILVPDRQEIPVFQIIMAHKSPNGEVQYLSTIMRDISERKRAEAARRASEERYADVITNARIGIFEASSDGKLLAANDALGRMFGYQSGEEMTREVSDISGELYVNPERRQHWIQVVRERGYVSNFEFQARKKDGSSFWLSLIIRLNRKRSDGSFDVDGFALDITERKLAEDQLKQSKSRYQLLVENIPSVSWETNEKGETSFISPNVYKIFGFTPEEIYQGGESVWFGRIHPADCDEVEQAYLDLINNGVRFDVEYRIKHKEGHFIWLHDQADLVKTEGGVRRAYGVFSDITERKRAEEALNKETAFTDTALDAQTDTFFLFEPATGKALRWNRSFSEISGYSDEEIARLPAPASYYGPEDLKRAGALTEEVLQTGTGAIELELICKDGRRVPTEYRVSLIRDEEGEAKYIISIGRDITDHKRAEEALRAERDRAQQYLDVAGAMFIALDNRGTVTLVNSKGSEILGFAPQEVVGKNWFDNFLPDADRDQVKEVYRRLIAGELKPLEYYENAVMTKDGEKRMIAWHNTLLTDRESTIVGTLSSGEDITKRKLAEDELKRHRVHLEELVAQRTEQLEHAAEALKEAKEAAEAANQAKSAFLANMSHEIRTPMNAVLGYAQLLLRDQMLNEQQRHQVNAIHQSGNHLLTLINNILEMSKIEAGRTTFNPISFDLHGLLKEVELMFAEQTQTKGIRLGFRLDIDLPRFIETDSAKVRQVVINLLSNALKFTDTGRIDVRASATPLDSDGTVAEKYVVAIAVEDTGCGIDPEYIETIFEAFEQTAAGTRYGGTGLGMAISRGFARLLNGDLTVESAVDSGSCFRFTFEARLRSPEQMLYETIRPLPSGLAKTEKRRKVLVVDDTDTNRQLLAELLSGVGFETRPATDGKRAIEAHDEWGPDLILMDLRMPGMGGTEAIRRLRANGSQVAIIAISASVSSEIRVEAITAGANGFIAKPHSDAELFTKIGEVLNLDYLYSTAPSSDATPIQSDDTNAIARAVAGLPEGLISKLREATISAQIDRINALIDGVAEQSPDVAKLLRYLAARYDYEALLTVLEHRSG